MYAKDWFAYQGDIELELWMAPKVIDLQYMTCLPCDENFFCAPGSQNGIKIILFVSPLSCQKNADKDHLSGCLVHEITHHIVRDISQATVFSMKRKKDLDVPMWIEEGLCQLIQSEVHPYLYHKLSEDIAKTTRWYDFEELWNDLSSCTDTTTAYLQAYKETKTFIETKGKMELIRLLYLNRTHDVNWNNLPYGENNA
ncbi:MAG: hypothetical protein HY881_14725 [Deltaproteobacteria bacterium]|nr:hypothetical protein [Deltaproteobacteria bacterium]